MFALIVDLHVVPEMHERFLGAIEENSIVTARAEPGCLRFDVVRDNADRNHFLLYELYIDEAAFEAHRATPHFARWREAAAQCLADPGGQRNTAATVVVLGDSAADPGGAQPAKRDRATALVVRPDEEPMIDRGGGVRTVHLVSPAVGASQFLCGTTEFDPGASLPRHSHNCEESVTVLEGIATFEHGTEMVELRPGDTTWVPGAAVHRFLNRGTALMRILWVYGRVDATRTTEGVTTLAAQPPPPRDDARPA